MNYYQTNNIFQKNDKVFVNGTNIGGRTYNNQIATILLIDNNNDIYLVKFKDENLGIIHPIYGKGTDEINKNMLIDQFEKTTKIYKITIFDDGRQEYELYTNRWLKVNSAIIEKGKVSLINENNPNICINSISEWKIQQI
jgi:hypothetical protein